MAITGVGIVTACGIGYEPNARGFRQGVRCFRRVSLFDVTRQRAQSAAEVEIPDGFPPVPFPSRHLARLDRSARMLLWATAEAWRQSGFEPQDDLPLVLGTTCGGMGLGEMFHGQATTQTSRCCQASRAIFYQAQRQALAMTEFFGFSGPINIITNACASGANAVGHAWHLVRTGQANRVLAGGYDGLCQLVFSGFDSLQALTTTLCRPFDANRDGLALGEGAAMFALESIEHARRRGARILAEIAGYGTANDHHHLTQPHPNGDAALAAMNAACQSAAIAPEQVAYVNAHGTGTVLNDSAEIAAIRRWAGAHTPKLAVSSTKAGIGHLLGAAGAVEAAICLMALRGQWLPPSTTIGNPDPDCTFQLVRNPTDAKFEYALSNSFGFGGANASLLLRRWT